MPFLRAYQLIWENHREREIKECAMKKQKMAALLFPSLITSIYVVSEVTISAKEEKIKNKGALIARTVERIAGEIVAAVPLEPVVVARAKKVTGIERRLQELSDSINECVEAQKQENQRFWNYFIHLVNHMHQFAVYMKKKNNDFPDTLLQQFNFQTAE